LSSETIVLIMLTFNALARTNLELPLCGHDLGISTGDLDTCEQASLVVSLYNISAVDLASTDTAVVWALWSRETSRGPAVWLVKHIEEGVLLLKTEPWLVGSVSLHELGTLVTVVVLVWGSIGIPALSDNQNVGGTAEWVGEDGYGSEVNIRVVAWGLSCGGTVKVPFWEILNLELARFWDLGEGLEGNLLESFRGISGGRVGGWVERGWGGGGTGTAHLGL
jgi:hypothetical protein